MERPCSGSAIDHGNVASARDPTNPSISVIATGWEELGKRPALIGVLFRFDRITSSVTLSFWEL